MIRFLAFLNAKKKSYLVVVGKTEAGSHPDGTGDEEKNDDGAKKQGQIPPTN